MSWLMRRRAWSEAILLLAIVWATLSGHLARSYAPPVDVKTFDAFIKHYGQPAKIKHVQDGHSIAFVSVPEWHLWVNLPSSEPGYVFDRDGNLVDWSADPGDDQLFQDRWL